MNRKEEMELLPCPFCGGKVKVCVGENNFVDACVSCDACSASGPIFDNDPETGGFSTDPEGDAIKHWNTRTALRASAAPEERGKKVWDEGEHEGCGIESERAFKREQIDAELARTLTDGAAYVQQIRSTVIEECARVAENYGEAGSGSRNQKRRSGIANAIRALPSDSGKAAPVAWQFQRHDGQWFNCDSKPKDLDKNPHKYRPLYAALAPATEGMETLKPDRNLARLLRAAVDDGLFANNPDAEPVIQKWFEAHCEPWPEAPAISSARREAPPPEWIGDEGGGP